MTTNSFLGMIHVADIGISESDNKLRDVHVDTEDYKNLRASIEEKGLINAIAVRKNPAHEEDQDAPQWLLVDGAHRFTAYKSIFDDGNEDFAEIPARALDIGDDRALVYQVIGNAGGVRTSKKEYAAAIRKILDMNPDMTQKDLAKELNVTGAFISSQLSLNNLVEPVMEMLEDGTINTSIGIGISRLPADEQEAFAAKAKGLGTEDALKLILDRRNQIKEADKAGRKANVWTPPNARARKSKDIVAFYQAAVDNDDHPLHGMTGMEAVKWIVQQDDETINASKAQHDASMETKRLNGWRNHVRKMLKRSKVEFDNKETLDELLAKYKGVDESSVEELKSKIEAGESVPVKKKEEPQPEGE